MCVAEKYTDRLNCIVNDMQKEMEGLSKMNSNVDIELSTMYHEIEMSNFSASAGYMKMKELQDVLRKRRLIKHEVAIMQNVTRELDIPKMQSTIAKSVNMMNKTINGKNGNLVYTDGWNLTFADLIKK